jgi:hypothetical protein
MGPIHRGHRCRRRPGFKVRKASNREPPQSTIGIAAVQTAIEYEYRFTEYRFTEYEYDEIRCDLRSWR